MLVDLPVTVPVIAPGIAPVTISTAAPVLEELALLAAVVIPVSLLPLAIELLHWLTLFFPAIM